MPSMIPLDNSLGAIFIGIMISTAQVLIYGVTCLQAYNYFIHHCSTDRWFLKLFVGILLAPDYFLQSGILIFALLGICYYGYTVTNFGDYEFLAKPYW
ncbi:hypothetical protein BT96DRAFT_826302 [Gymnopus androsaceus JB14]|uniref:Amino acid transporter transmembrane domain-containing protein n=1 Tax=Gymnopus androsaceus JB14 TaxID=1447944 RepID=A0A6A4HCQ5_9AGAR|nr:hypothetical protein BT96DRAFT_826302 [Gymnopus androsaceus JB14]